MKYLYSLLWLCTVFFFSCNGGLPDAEETEGEIEMAGAGFFDVTGLQRESQAFRRGVRLVNRDVAPPNPPVDVYKRQLPAHPRHGEFVFRLFLEVGQLDGSEDVYKRQGLYVRRAGRGYEVPAGAGPRSAVLQRYG